MGVIVLLVVGMLIEPILNKRQRLNFDKEKSDIEISELQRKKNALFREIKDIELDFQMGKISESDFDELTTSYRGKAMETMKQIDSLGGVKKMKPSKNQDFQVPKAEEAGYCRECGSALFKTADFCGVCGKEV